MKSSARLASVDDIVHWYGHVPYTMRAVVLEVDGEPKAIGGVLHKQGILIAFMDLKGDPKEFPVSLMKATYIALRDIFSHYQQPIYAMVNDALDSAPGFLMRIGFEPIDEAIMVYKRQE